MLKEVFRSPQFNEKKGCCFKCQVTPEEVRDTGSNAKWRNERLDLWSCLARLLEDGKISPLCWPPGITLHTFKLVWMHIVVLGVGADWLGKFLTTLLPQMDGNNKGERIHHLWQRIQE